MYKEHPSFYTTGQGALCEYTGPATLPALSGEFSILCLFSVDTSDTSRHKRVLNIGDRAVGPHVGMSCSVGNSFNLSGAFGTTSGVAAVPTRKDTFWNIGCFRRASGQVSIALVDVLSLAVEAGASYEFSATVPMTPITIGNWNVKAPTEYFSGGIQWVVVLSTFVSNQQLVAIARGDYRVLEEFSANVVEAVDLGVPNPVGVKGTALTPVGQENFVPGGPGFPPMRSTYPTSKLNAAFAALQELRAVGDVRSGVTCTSVDAQQDFEVLVRTGRDALDSLLRL